LRAKFVHPINKKRESCEWIKELQMPEWYCSNWTIDSTIAEFYNIKTHHCHVFIETHLTIAFRALPDKVLNPLFEINEFLKSLTTMREDVFKEMY